MKNPRDNMTIPTVPHEYGGKWIAWDREGTKILAAADDLKSAEEACA